MKKRVIGLLMTAVLGIGILAGCGSSQGAEGGTSAGDNTDEKVVVVGMSSDLQTLDPDQMYEVYGNLYAYACYDNLYAVQGNTTEPKPSLATGYSVDDSGKVFTFELRDDVIFSSGNQMTSADVVFSINRLINLKGNPSYNAANIESVEADGDYKVKITLKETEAPGTLLAKLSSNAFAILDSKILKENGGLDTEDASTADTATKWLDSHSAGSGPYTLESWTTGEELILVKNKNYWGDCGDVDKFILKEISDTNSEIQMLQSGDIDVAMELSNDNKDQITSPDISVETAQTDTITFLFMNGDENISGPLANEKVREAISYAIDYDGLKSLCGDGAVSIGSFETLDMGGYERESGYRDIEKAKKLLTEAGYPDGFDTTLTVGNVVNEGMAWSVIGQKIQGDLAEIGVNIKISTVEPAVLYDDYRNGKSSFIVMYWSPDYFDMSNTALGFMPSNVYDGLIGTRGNWKVDEARAKQYTDLIDVVKTSSNDDKRSDAVQKLQSMYAEDGNCIFLLQHPKIYAYNQNVVSDVEYNNLTKLMLKDIKMK